MRTGVPKLLMPSRRMPRLARRRSRRDYAGSLVRSRVPRCVVCEERLDLPFLSVRYGRGQAHPFCAACDRIGLRGLVRTSGRL